MNNENFLLVYHSIHNFHYRYQFTVSGTYITVLLIIFCSDRVRLFKSLYKISELPNQSLSREFSFLQ